MLNTNSKNKYQHVYNYIAENIRNGSYSITRCLPSSKKLADELGVSRPTLIKAYDELEAEGLIERRAGIGIFVRQSRNLESNYLGYLGPEVTISPRQFPEFVHIFSKMFESLSQRVNDHDFIMVKNGLPFGKTEEEHIGQAKDITRKLVDMEVNGVFFLPLEVSYERQKANKEIVDMLQSSGISVVLMDRDIHCDYRSDLDLVCVDNETGSFELTEYLIGLGLKKIDYVCFGTSKSLTSFHYRARGYMKAMKANGLEAGEKNIHEYNIKLFNQPTKSEIDKASRQLLEQIGDTEAIVCLNDLIASVLMESFLRIGIKVPDDIRIVGFDDESFCTYMPAPLTTMKQPVEDMGAEAFNLMKSRIENPDVSARKVELKTELVIRESCGCNL